MEEEERACASRGESSDSDDEEEYGDMFHSSQSGDIGARVAAGVEAAPELAEAKSPGRPASTQAAAKDGTGGASNSSSRPTEGGFAASSAAVAITYQDDAKDSTKGLSDEAAIEPHVPTSNGMSVAESKDASPSPAVGCERPRPSSAASKNDDDVLTLAASPSVPSMSSMTSLATAPSLGQPRASVALATCSAESTIGAGSAPLVLEKPKKKKKKRREKERERVDALSPLAPLSGTGVSGRGLAPLPSIADLQQQMNKRREEAQVRCLPVVDICGANVKHLTNPFLTSFTPRPTPLTFSMVGRRPSVGTKQPSWSKSQQKMISQLPRV